MANIKFKTRSLVLASVAQKTIANCELRRTIGLATRQVLWCFSGERSREVESGDCQNKYREMCFTVRVCVFGESFEILSFEYQRSNLFFKFSNGQKKHAIHSTSSNQTRKKARQARQT